MEYQFFYVHLYVCRLCINFQDLSASLLGDIPPFFVLLTLITRFVIDFLSISEVVMLSAITTDNCQPLRSRSVYRIFFN